MRRVRYQVAASLDGYIAGPQGEYDWIVVDPDIDFRELFSGFDTLLMGRKSYEASKAVGGGGMKGMKTIVFSRTLQPKDCRGATLSTDPTSTIAELRRTPGKDIWLWGGGLLFRELLALGLVDTVEIAVVPVLLGGGIPMLPAPATRATLKLTRHRVYEKTGTVLLQYDVGQ